MDHTRIERDLKRGRRGEKERDDVTMADVLDTMGQVPANLWRASAAPYRLDLGLRRARARMADGAGHDGPQVTEAIPTMTGTLEGIELLYCDYNGMVEIAYGIRP